MQPIDISISALATAFPPFLPMEAAIAPTILEGRGWQYEPKWDGFRCLVFRDPASARRTSWRVRSHPPSVS